MHPRSSLTPPPPHSKQHQTITPQQLKDQAKLAKSTAKQANKEIKQAKNSLAKAASEASKAAYSAAKNAKKAFGSLVPNKIVLRKP